jgi:hypothetical protein
VHPDLGEALFLRAIRQLHGRYEERPIGRVTWVDKSESQQRAETVASQVYHHIAEHVPR